MTILKDISDTLRDAVDIAKEMDIKLNKQTSIAKLSSAATLQFPVITSRSILYSFSLPVGVAVFFKVTVFP